MALIKKGAEANLYLEDFERVLHIAGQGKVIVKSRVRKRYRIQEIDEQLRSSRTALESKLLSNARRAGVPTPVIFEVDLSDMRIVMEFIKGRQVKQVLEKMGLKAVGKLCKTIGIQVARLHSSGIVHGDLTTSNMILTKEGKVYFVDFGLGEHSRSTEERGVDLHLLKRALQSIHFRITDRAYRAVLSGYRKEFGKEAEEVFRRADEIGRRGRYVPRAERA